MYKGKKILAILPARGGSKGIPHKNIKMFDGQPLLYWTLDEAQKSKYLDACVVSTDDAEIMDKVQKYSGGGTASKPLAAVG